MVREPENRIMESNLCEKFRPRATFQIILFPIELKRGLLIAFGSEKHIGTNISFPFVHENRSLKDGSPRSENCLRGEAVDLLALLCGQAHVAGADAAVTAVRTEETHVPVSA